jgi:hypothetical protein
VPKTLATEKTVAALAKTGTFKMTQIIKTAPAPAKTAPASSAMTLHTGKGAAQVSSFHTPELEGRVSLWTKSDNSLGSLKEYCMKWNDADFVDTASSGKKKTLAGTPAPSNPDVTSKLFSIQQRLYRLAEATNVSIYPYISPVPENVGCSGYGHPEFSNIFFNLADFPTAQHISSIRASNPSHRGPG